MLAYTSKTSRFHQDTIKNKKFINLFSKKYKSFINKSTSLPKMKPNQDISIKLDILPLQQPSLTKRTISKKNNNFSLYQKSCLSLNKTLQTSSFLLCKNHSTSTIELLPKTNEVKLKEFKCLNRNYSTLKITRTISSKKISLDKRKLNQKNNQSVSNNNNNNTSISVCKNDSKKIKSFNNEMKVYSFKDHFRTQSCKLKTTSTGINGMKKKKSRNEGENNGFYMKSNRTGKEYYCTVNLGRNFIQDKIHELYLEKKPLYIEGRLMVGMVDKEQVVFLCKKKDNIPSRKLFINKNFSS